MYLYILCIIIYIYREIEREIGMFIWAIVYTYVLTRELRVSYSHVSIQTTARTTLVGRCPNAGPPPANHSNCNEMLGLLYYRVLPTVSLGHCIRHLFC